MATAVKISEQELLEELARAAAGNAPANARTTQELAMAANVSHDVVIDRIRQLHRAGRVVVHMVSRTNVIGRPCVIPAYTILPAKKR